MKNILCRLLLVLLLLPAASMCYPADEQVANDVTAAVGRYPSAQPYTLRVDVTQGRVTLTGSASSSEKKRLIGDIVAGVPGVRELTNNMVVGETEPVVYADEESRLICKKVRERIDATTYLQDYTLSLNCSGGSVTLRGSADTASHIAAIGEIAGTTSGVLKVINLMHLRTPPDDGVLSREVYNVLVNQNHLDLSGLSYSVASGVVTWTGHVERHERIDEVLSRTLMVPGVRDIRSNVTVGRED